MKKLLKTTLAIMLFSLVFYSCSREEERNEKQNKITAKQLEFIGIEHNIMLGDALNFLKENKSDSDKVKSSQMKDKFEKFLISKIRSNSKYSEKSNTIGVNYVKNLFNTTNKPNLSIQENSNNLSNEVALYIEELQEILSFDTEDIEGDKINEKISELELRIESEIDLTDKQLILLYSATQTARYSSKYWIENMEEWENLSSENLTLSFHEGDDDGHNGCNCRVLGTIIAADVAGAIGAAVTTWALNFFPGAGQIAYGGAIVAGAAGTSAAAATHIFINWWWE